MRCRASALIRGLLGLLSLVVLLKRALWWLLVLLVSGLLLGLPLRLGSRIGFLFPFPLLMLLFLRWLQAAGVVLPRQNSTAAGTW